MALLLDRTSVERVILGDSVRRHRFQYGKVA